MIENPRPTVDITGLMARIRSFEPPPEHVIMHPAHFHLMRAQGKLDLGGIGARRRRRLRDRVARLRRLMRR